MRIGIYYVYSLDGTERQMSSDQLERMTAKERAQCDYARLCDRHWPYSLEWTYRPTADGWEHDGREQRGSLTEYTYIVKTDAVTAEIEAPDIDTAAKVFAADEFPGAGISDCDDLMAHIAAIDGAWCWIESQSAPDGARRGLASN